MRENANVLVTAAGTIVSQGIMKSLKLANSIADGPIKYRIVAVDASSEATGLYRSDVGAVVPLVISPEYIDSIIKICKEQMIHAILVGSDEELATLSQASERIQSETGARVIANPPEVIRVGQDKWRTFEFLKRNNLPYAESSLVDDQYGFVQEFGFPLVVKPREGHGSLQMHIAKNRDEVESAISEIERVGWHPMLQEYLSDQDQEYTSGVTIDKEGKYVMSSISMRRKLKGGQTYKAFIDDFQDVRKFAEETAMKLGARGPVNLQARLARGKPRVFEINPRFSATVPIRAAAGVNEPDIIYRNFCLNEEIKVNKYRKLVCMRYMNEVYIPYDSYEKILMDGKIETQDSFILDYF
ncbi:MAG: ATP-grasp domain-containing protein [Nitrososphaerales archaeon]